MSYAHEFSSSPPQKDVAQSNWLYTRNQGRDDDMITVAAETVKTASTEKRMRRRARKTWESDIGDMGKVACVGGRDFHNVNYQ